MPVKGELRTDVVVAELDDVALLFEKIVGKRGPLTLGWFLCEVVGFCVKCLKHVTVGPFIGGMMICSQFRNYFAMKLNYPSLS